MTLEARSGCGEGTACVYRASGLLDGAAYPALSWRVIIVWAPESRERRFTGSRLGMVRYQSITDGR